MQNDLLIGLVGKATSGKSSSLRGLKDPEGVLYLNCEGKRLPFKSKFREELITDPMQVLSIMDGVTTSDKYHTVIIDSITYLMDMFELLYVLDAADGRKAWGNFQKYFKTLFQDKIAKCGKVVIVTAHVVDEINEEAVREVKIPIKGALKNQGIESYFSTVIAAKKIKTSQLEKYNSPLLNISEREKALKFKHVLQTDITADTVNERLRIPLDAFSSEETFIDGDIQLVVERLKEYYA